MQNVDPAPEPKPLTINQETLSPTMIVQTRDGKCKCCFWKTTGQAMERLACVYWSQLQGQSRCNSCLFFPPVWCWNMGHISESSEEAPCLYDGTAKSNNERTMEGQDRECENSLPYRTNSMTDILIAKNVRWLGHVHRIDINRLPRQLL